MTSAFVLAFTISFMLFIYEPITTFASNTSDFWFGFNLMIKANIIFSILVFLFISLFSACVRFISKKTKISQIFDIFILIMNVCFVTLYIQGNYLAGKLPTLDGKPIEWSKYTGSNIISCVLFITILVINIFIYKYRKDYKKIISWVACAICAMLSVSLLSVVTTNPKMYREKGTYTSMNKNINKISSNKNFVILLIDMVDSKTFDEVMKETDKYDLMKDFTYFPDTLGAYPFTRESVPFIFSGKWYEAKTDIAEYSNKAFNKSKFLKKLEEEKYDINIYEQEFLWSKGNIAKMSNVEALNSDISLKNYFKQESKYILFKYLPYPLKKYSKIETLDYNAARKTNKKTKNIYIQNNKKVYDLLSKKEVQKDNYFQFLHIEGGHYPWDTDENFNHKEKGTYEEKLVNSIKVLKKYLKLLKESGQYDNSVIIIMADHGNNGYDYVGRQNPILYIKGIDEHHDELKISSKKVSFIDLNDSIYYDLLKGKKSTELLQDVSNNRIRRFIWYKYVDKMYEQTLDGHAWESDKLKNTGKEYNR